MYLGISENLAYFYGIFNIFTTESLHKIMVLPFFVQTFWVILLNPWNNYVVEY